MSAQIFETVLARLYSDEGFRKTFLNDQNLALQLYDLTASEKEDFRVIDIIGLRMAAKSYAHKREKRQAAK